MSAKTLLRSLKMARRKEQRILGKKAGKFWMVRYIRRLFKLRPELPNPNTWACVMRDKKLVMVRNFDVELMDSVIMFRFLASGETPSWFSTYSVVRKRWHELARAEIELSQTTMGDPTVGVSCITSHSKSGVWQILGTLIKERGTIL